MIAVKHLYISDGHNYAGHHGQPPGKNILKEVAALNCVAGRGIVGDRYFDHQQDFEGQITFFEEEVFDALRAELPAGSRSPSVFRRNVITRGLDLNSLIGREFEIQGIRFLGVEECKPCYWMNAAYGPGAHAALKGRGGLRARILKDGVLEKTGARVDD